MAPSTSCFLPTAGRSGEPARLSRSASLHDVKPRPPALCGSRSAPAWCKTQGVARTAADLVGLPVAALAGYRKARRLIRVVPVKFVFKSLQRLAPAGGGGSSVAT